jgi:hypothetical protein
MQRTDRSFKNAREGLTVRRNMAHIDVEATFHHSFDLDRFCVTAELTEAKHHFSFRDKHVSISIPPASDPNVPRGSRAVECYLWKTDGHVPLEYQVNRVEVSIVVGPLSVPEEALSRPSFDQGLFTENERTKLGDLMGANALVAVDAFKHWLKVLRWASRIGHIGEPQIRYPDQTFGGAVLREANTNRRIWNQGYRVVPVRSKAVTLTQWQACQEALSARRTPEIWFDFLFDGEQRINNRDLIGAVLSMAVALEVIVRRLTTHGLLKQRTEPIVLEILDLTNFRAFFNRLRKLTYWDKEWERVTDFDQFNQLMDLRNDIMHSADTSGLDERNLRKLYATTKTFVYFVSEFLDGQKAT